VSAKSGGHSYAAYGLAGDVVVDLGNLKGLTVNPDGTAIVQTGNRLGDVATGIFNQGQRALAHGSCPYVKHNQLYF
jgi:FAD binding domain